MKKDIHPEWYEAKVYCNGEYVMSVGATVPEIRVEVWSGTHPFYTGQQRILDTEGQVERFVKRLERREEMAPSKRSKAQRRRERRAVAEYVDEEEQKQTPAAESDDTSV
jgi:large subunit ribosomal protein L31